MSSDLRNLIAVARVALDDLAREAHFLVGAETGMHGDTTRGEVRDMATALDAALETAARMALLETSARLPECISCTEHQTRMVGIRRVARQTDELRKIVYQVVEQTDLRKFRRQERRLKVAELLVHLAVELRDIDRGIAALWSTAPAAPASQRRRRAA